MRDIKKKRKKSDALLQLPEQGAAAMFGFVPSAARQEHYWRYTAIISLCHTPGRTRGDSQYRSSIYTLS